MSEWFERWQVPLYLAGLSGGTLLGFFLPEKDNFFGMAINPALILLLYATFLAVPFERIRESVKDVRFLAVVLILNFLVVPAVVFVLSRFILFDRALLVGVLLVLLCPCVDYVMVFTRLAHGAWEKILAVSPLLMLLQLALLPLYLLAFAGRDVVESVQIEPFAQAFLLLIVFPLALSAMTQRFSQKFTLARHVMKAMEAAMVPLMAVTLFAVAASQFSRIVPQMGLLLTVVPIYVAFLVVMPLLGTLAGKISRQDARTRRALAFSCSTRNSLVVLPLALALPDALSFAAAVVVTQTIVELVGMVSLVRLFPRLIRDRDTSAED